MIAVLSGMLLTAGCSGNLSVPSTVPVKGTVTYKGEPTPGIRVQFHNQVGTREDGFIPTGETGTDGGFVMSTVATPLNGFATGKHTLSLLSSRYLILSNQWKLRSTDLKAVQ